MTVLSLALAASVAVGVPQESRAEPARYRVETLSPGGQDQPARVMITNLETSRRHIIAVNSTLGPLRRTVLRDDQARVLLLCEKGFVVVDPEGRMPAEEIYARDPVAAPGGRWIAYQRFYPATHPGTTEGVALYDTRRSRADNHAAYPVAEEREWRAGWPIFPPASAWKSAGLVTPPEEAYVLTSPLMWMGAPDAPALVFTIRKGDVDTLVLADPAAEPVQACAAPLPGPAERWGTKTITMKPTPGPRHELHVVSGALDADRPEVTVRFGPDCEVR